MEVLEKGPALAVPAAWTVAGLSLAGVLNPSKFILPMLVVMLICQVGFLALGWIEMTSGVLKGWRLVILLGIPFTAAGLAGEIVSIPLLSLISVAYWLKAPGIGMAYIWDQGGSRTYLGLGALAVAAGCGFDTAFLYGYNALPMLAVAGAAQTLGIWKAVVDDSGK